MTEPTSWTDLVPRMQTGDLILFAGTSSAARIIETATGGPYSHTSMIFRPDAATAPQLWEEVSFVTGKDKITHDDHNGAQLGDALELVNEYIKQGDVPWYRPLVWDRPKHFNTTVLEIMKSLDDTPWGTSVEMVGDFIEGRVFNHDSGTAHMVCSALVASTYQHVGLLNDDHPPNYYSPSSFAPGHHDLVLQLGAELGAAIEIDVS